MPASSAKKRSTTRPLADTAAKKTAAKAPDPEPEPVLVDEKKAWPIYAKIAWVQQHVTNVEKTGQVSFGRTTYAHMQEHGLIEVLRPLLREVGLAVHPDIQSYERQGNHLQIHGQLVVANTIPDTNGNVEIVRAGFTNEGVDQADKASNKALTGWMKYALQKFFMVPTEGIDDNDESADKKRDTSAHPGGDIEAPKVAPEDAEALRQTVAAAVKEGHLTNQRVQALLQGTYGVAKIADLRPEDAAAVAQWVAQQVKGG